MTLKHVVLAATLLCSSSLLLFGRTSHATDTCSDVPTCKSGTVLTLIPAEARLNCAMFSCTDTAIDSPSGKAVTSDKELRTILETDPSVACNSDEVRVRMHVNGNMTWTCLLKSRYSALKEANAVKDAVFPLFGKTTDDLTDVERCADGTLKVRVRYQTHSELANVGQPRCVPPTIYRGLKSRGLIISD